VGYAESLFAMFLFLGILCVQRRRYGWLYALIPLMGFTRPGVLAFALFIGLYGIWRLFRRRVEPLRRRDVIHILAAGWQATSGWTDAAIRHFAQSHVAAVVPLAVSEADHEQPVSAGIRRTAGGRSATVVPRRKAGGIVTGALPSAPLLEAGFWRADVIREIGLSTACGDALAAADLAAGLTASRADVVLEPDSRVVSGPPQQRRSPFLAGLHAERLFWRSLSCERTVPALLAHGGEVLRHAALTAPLGTFAMLAGRLAALVQFGSCFGRTRQLRALMREAAIREAEGDSSARTYRIDESHEMSRPHIDQPARELKRSA